MINFNHIKTVFSFFYKAGMRAKRTKLLFILAGIPTLIFGIVWIVTLLNPDASYPSSLFEQIGGGYFFQMYIQLLALFYGSSVISDEIEGKTLVYLTTSPASRPSILCGKFLANFAITSVIITAGLLASFLLANLPHVLHVDYLVLFAKFLGVALLAAFTYSALFIFLGTIMNRSVLMGLFIIFGWENIVYYMPGSTQNFTVVHYVKSLLPLNLTGSKGFLAVNLSASSELESILFLLLAGIFFIGLATVIFYTKEYTLSENE